MSDITQKEIDLAHEGMQIHHSDAPEYIVCSALILANEKLAAMTDKLEQQAQIAPVAIDPLDGYPADGSRPKEIIEILAQDLPQFDAVFEAEPISHERADIAAICEWLTTCISGAPSCESAVGFQIVAGMLRTMQDEISAIQLIEVWE